MRLTVYTETLPSLGPSDGRETGIGRYVLDLVNGLVQTGHQVTVVAPPSTIGTQQPTGALEMIALRPSRIARLQPLTRALAVHRHLRRRSPEYLLIGDPAAHRVVSLLRSPAGGRYCPILYGSELLEWTKMLAYNGASPARRVRRWLQRRYLDNAYMPIVISQYTRRLLGELTDPVAGAAIVYPGVTEACLTRRTGRSFRDTLVKRHSRQKDRTHIILLTVGRISERKNQFSVLRALAKLRSATDLEFHYYIVGNVDADIHAAYRADLDRFITQHQLADTVTFVTQTTEEQKLDYLDASDIFIMLSKQVSHSVEGFGISAIEASCRARPIIVSTHGGMPETLIEGQTGLSIGPDDHDAAAGAILRLARDPGLRLAMGKAGAEYVRRRFTPQAMASSLIAQLASR